MQVQQSNPSFGMAYHVNAKSFRNFSTANMEKVRSVIKSNETRLEEATKGVEFGIAGSGESKITVGTMPETLGFFGRLKYIYETVKYNIKNKGEIPPYMDSFNVNNFTGETLIETADRTKKACLNNRGTSEQAKKILGDLKSK